MASWGKHGGVYEGTLATLQGLGTNDGIAVGALGVLTDRGGLIFRCDSVAASTSTWKQATQRSATTDDLHALGTDDGVAVGEFAYDLSAKGPCECIWANATDSIWQLASAADPGTVVQRTHWEGYDDASVYSPYVQVQANGGTIGNLSTIVDADEPGLMTVDITNALDSRGGLRTGYRCMAFQTEGHHLTRTRIRIDADPTDAAEDMELQGFGPVDNVPATETTDGVYFWLSQASANWRCKATESSTSDNEDSGVAFAVDTWFDLVIHIHNDVARFLIDGVLVATISGGNIPNDVRLMHYGFMLTRVVSSGTTATMDVDYSYYSYVKDGSIS